MTRRSDPTITIQVVEDDTELGDRIARSLRDEGHQVRLAASVEAIKPADPPPALAIVDIRLPRESGLAAVDLLRASDPSLPVVFISGQSEPQEIIDAMKRGAIEFLLKPFSLDQLLDAVDRGIAARQADDARHARESAARHRLDQLTDREREVCALLVKGFKTGQVATQLGITAGTAKIHRMHILDKMQVESIGEIARLLEQGGLMQTWNPRPPEAPEA